MDWETIGAAFERAPTIITKLVSIDLVKGQLRAYEATVGGKPHLRQIVDIVGYEPKPALPNCDFEFDTAAIEAFRINPHHFASEQGWSLPT